MIIKILNMFRFGGPDVLNNDENLIMDLMPNNSKFDYNNKNVQVMDQEPHPPPQLPPRNRLPYETTELMVGGFNNCENSMVTSLPSQAILLVK